MSEKPSTEIIRRFARAWASMDGRVEAFERESDGEIGWDDPIFTGHFLGYMAEAEELLRRAGCVVALSHKEPIE